ncbi:MAG: hypothetical protein L0323_18905 [Planctomycetes bacterium]|nr:hypothetical protein [Planctomycetota bacterium]
MFRTQNFLSPPTSPGTWVELTSGLPVKKPNKNYRAAAVESVANPMIAHVGHVEHGVYSTANGGNTWTQTLPNVSVRALAVDPTNGQIAFAATSAGTYRTANGGGAWTSVDPGPATVDVEIDPTSPSTVYAVRSTTVRFSTNGGASWGSSPPPGTGYDLRAITRPHPLSPNWLYVCGAATAAGPAGTLDGDGVIYQATWTGPLPPGGPPWSANLATYGTPVYQAPGPFPRHNPFIAVSFEGANPGWLLVGLDGGGFYWSSNALTVSPPPTFSEANTKSPLAPPTDTPLIGTEIRELAAQPVSVLTPTKLFAGGDSRTLWFRDPNPPGPLPAWQENWKEPRIVPMLPAGSGGWGWHAITSVAFDERATPDRVYVGDGIRVQYTTDDGMTWILLGQTFGGEVTEIAVAPEIAGGQPNATLLVATTVGVYRSTDGGSTFSAPTGPPNVVNFTFDRNYTAAANHSVFAAVEGAAGGFFRSLDPSDGATWSGAMNTGLPANPGLTIIGHKGGQTLFAGSGKGNLEGVFISDNQGANWRITTPLGGTLARVFGLVVATVGPNEVVFASTRGGVVRSQDDGATWTGYGGLVNSRCGPLRLAFFDGSVKLLVGTEGHGVEAGIVN